jgi:predicted nuclease of predicted toxin-antitoxin system
MQGSTDTDVLARASANARVLVSADTDFGVLPARQPTTAPSVLLIRRRLGRRAAEQLTVILDNLEAVAAELTAGAVVGLAEDRIRIRLRLLPG